jgi:VanZ family protein
MRGRNPSSKALYVWLIMVLVLSVYPFSQVNTSLKRFDLLVHFVVYAITGALFFVTLTESKWNMLKKMPGLLAVALASGYGLAMEYVQSYLPRRTFSLSDAAANALGAAAAVLLIMYLRQRARAGEPGEKGGA